MDVWHKETTPGTTGSRCTIKDENGLFVAECIASDASRIAEAPAMVAALRDADQELQAWRKKFHPSEWPDKPVVHTAIRDKIRAILSRIDGATPTGEPATPTGELVTVRADHLAALVEAAGKYADDLATGLEDGTYEDRADLDAVEAAIAAVKGENPAPTADDSTCQHCGDERPLGPDSSVWTCGACNGLNCD